jgi:quinohemoprotein ethanol dehydrogenase
VRRGLSVYQSSCSNCHGNQLVSPGTPAPDLRESAIALNWESFRHVVKEGALLPRLMPRFDELSEEQLRDVFTLIRSGARDALKAARTHVTSGVSAGRTAVPASDSLDHCSRGDSHG